MALLSRARVLARAIKADECCPSCLFSFARELRDDEEGLDVVRRDCHEFWDACVRAISLPAHGDPKHPSAPFFRRLVAATTKCALHAADVALEEYLLLTFFDGACSCLHACLFVGERSAVSRAQKKHKAFSNKRGAWPMRQEDLFPSGTDDKGMLIDVVKILRWSVDDKAPDPTLLLADLLYIAHPLVFPVLMESRKDLVLAVARWICNPESAMMLLDEEELNPAGLGLNEAKMKAAVTLIRCMRDAPDADPNALLQFTLEFEGILFESATMGLKLLDIMYGPNSKLAGDIAAFAAVVHTRIAQPDSAVGADVLAKVPQTSQLDIAGVIHAVLNTLASRRRICGGPMCGLSVHASMDPDTTFKRCSKCKVVYYCSTGCQKADWKGVRRIPHKAACFIICDIAKAADYKLPLQDFQRILEPYSQNPLAQYEWSLFTCSISSSLPMELIVRAREIHRDAALASGRPDRLAGAPDAELVASILRRQERFSGAA